MKIYVFVLVLSVLVAFGQSAKIDGPCPIKTNRTESFDPQRYVGKWHNIYTGPGDYACDISHGCQLTYISEYNENDHYFTVTDYHGLHYANFCSERFYQTAHDVDGRLLRNYFEIFVLRSRSMSMPDEVRDKLVKKMVDYGFTEQKLLKRNFNDCVEFDPGY